MPELPEVETMCRCVGAAVGARICAIEKPRSRLQSILISPHLPAFRRRVCGRTIRAVERLGKRVVLCLDNGDRIVIEPRMSGLVMLEDPPDTAHLRLVLHLEGGRAERLLVWDQRGLGVVRLVAPGEFESLLGPRKIGPDALAVSADELRSRLAPSRRAVKVALLDQKAVCGIGNLYASELLHRAGVHPALACRRLTRSQWQRVHGAMREVLEEAIRFQGSTLRDGTYRIAREEPGGFQYCHRVYQRHGQRCLQCGESVILRIVQAQRSTFFCPVCQAR